MNPQFKSHEQKQAQLKQKAEKKRQQRERQKKQREVESKKVFKIPKKVRNLSSVIDQIFNGTFPSTRTSEAGTIAAAYERYTRGQSTNYKNNLRKLMQFLLDEGVEFAHYPLTHPGAGIKAVCGLARYLDNAIRPLEEWRPRSHNSDRQISSLMRHLYCKYDVPLFFDKAWYSDTVCWMEWFVWVGQGGNIRKVRGLPVVLTKRQSHFMMKAPKDFDIPSAIRYGQIIDMGSNEFFCRQILRTRAGNDFTHEEFWFSIFRWLLSNPMMDSNQYGPIIDYIFHQKFVPSKLDENGHIVCPQPGFTMKDRDPVTLLKQVEIWHKHLGRERGGKLKSWDSSGFPGLFVEMGQDKNKVVWSIRELCTQDDLNMEGRTMDHCAASYGWSCSSGNTSIWSVESMDKEGTHKQLTLEVRNKERKLVQARGKRNCMPTEMQMRIVRQWCQNTMLNVSGWLI